MSLLLDKKYINYISSRLERFSWVRSTLALCKCPLCGDGKKGSKRRFYFYIDKYEGKSYNVGCKNCGHGQSFFNFLRDQDPALFQEYRMEGFKEYFGDSYRERKEEVVEEKRELKIVTSLEDAICIDDLNENHSCREYVANRLIPKEKWSQLYYHDNFKRFVSNYLDEEFYKNLPEDPRLIIPAFDTFGNLKFFQGRSLDKFSKMRYITIKVDEGYDKVYGENNIDRSKEVRVCEGPLDSLFISNCLATCDADLLKAKGDVYIPDNQFRNREICKRIDRFIDAGVKVVLFPRTFTYKDINDAVIGGMTQPQLENLIKANTFQGLRAKLRFGELRKV